VLVAAAAWAAAAQAPVPAPSNVAVPAQSGVIVPAVAGAPEVRERRVALVVGNAEYKLGPLRNPINDARAMSRALAQLGFDVTMIENTTKPELERAIGRFGRKLGPDTVGLFFFAGHGIQVGGRNFLVPIDATIETEPAAKLEAVDVEAVLDQMQAAKNRVNIVILDACRNDPFSRGLRSASRGLASMDAPIGTLIGYATAPGRTAADGTGANGLYTQELLKALQTPGLRVEDVLKRTRIGVVERSKGQQTPWESSSLIGDFYFSPAVGGGAPTQQAAAGAASPVSASSPPSPGGSVATVAPAPEAGAGASAAAPADRIAALAPRSAGNPAVDGVWSIALKRCSRFLRFDHEIVGRRVFAGKMAGRSATHNSPEKWDLAFNLTSPGNLEITGSVTTSDGISGVYRVQARETSANVYAGSGQLQDYSCDFEGRRLTQP
jgi:uncharacterized caspase-like protein